MNGVNKVILVGNLGKDPDVRHLESGAVVANFPLATTETFKGRDGNKVEQTEWHNIVLWRGLAEVAEKYLKKGKSVYIEGKIKTRSWEDKEGNKRYITEVVADNMVMLSRKDEQFETSSFLHNASENVAKKEPAVEPANTADDLPF